MGNWSASWRTRYIGRFQNGSTNPSQDTHPAGASLDGIVFKYGATVYHDISLGYALPQYHTRVDVGVNNLSDKQPPFLYANNTLNANTDPTDFDLIGRYYYARLTLTF
jgi:outer membrane receptor protein involved in Fe transport